MNFDGLWASLALIGGLIALGVVLMGLTWSTFYLLSRLGVGSR
jgi:hypothetical protein